MLVGGPYMGIGMTALMVLTLVVLAIAFWQLLRKAGFTPAIGLLMLVPLVNLGVALWRWRSPSGPCCGASSG